MLKQKKVNADDLKEEVKRLPYMTQNERREFIERIQKLNTIVEKNDEIKNQLSKSLPLLNRNGEYTGTYFKIIIGWAVMYNTIEDIIYNRDTKDLDRIKNSLEIIKDELEKYYKEAITANYQNSVIKKNMEIGIKNLDRFYEYGKCIAILNEKKIKDDEIKKILEKKENKDVFWLIADEKPNKTVANVASRIKEELEQIKSENKQEAIEAVKKIQKLFS